MKKIDIKKLALLGFTAGLILNQQQNFADEMLSSLAKNALAVNSNFQNNLKSNSDSKNSSSNPNDENLNYHLMSEDELLLELNDQGIALYKSLSPEGKELARYVASQMCQGTNKCEGLNACKTEKNACLGKGPCSGKGKCAIADKNLAVKIVADKMAKKRGALYQK